MSIIVYGVLPWITALIFCPKPGAIAKTESEEAAHNSTVLDMIDAIV